VDGSTSTSLPLRVLCLALLSCAVLPAVLLLPPAPAFATGAPEEPITEACPRSIFTPGKLCRTVNPHAKNTVGDYFAYNKGASCKEGGQTPLQAEAEVEDSEVSAELGGLKVNSEYTYCLVATNQSGETFGNAVTFMTEKIAPEIENLSATDITGEDATLQAQINPVGVEVTYEVWLEYPACQASGGGSCEARKTEVCGYGQLSGNDQAQTVSVDLTGLQPQGSYTYWVVARSTGGVAEAPHQTFATQAPGRSTLTLHEG
jgi:hypothetical protein